MSTFVDACRKEWDRIGVSGAVANEMAADLEADLAEAEADGVAPEEVLGNGFFDPAAFAASWASARGVVGSRPPTGAHDPRRPWIMAASTVVCVVVVLLGTALLVGVRHSSVSVASVAIRRQVMPPAPGMFVFPHRLFFAQQVGALAPIGLLLLAAGLVGLGFILWLWKPWSTRRNRGGSDRDIGMPSYL